MPDRFARDVRVRAYFLSLERKLLGQPSDPTADWCQAEQEFGFFPNLVQEGLARVASRLRGASYDFHLQTIYDVFKSLFRVPYVFPRLAM